MSNIRWFNETFENAPQLSGAAGSLIGILDACLLTGFNVKGVNSATYDSGTGLVTLTISAGHGYKVGQMVKVQGADQTEYNGVFRVKGVTMTTLTYEPDSAPSTTPATGTIDCRTAPATSWEKAYSGTNKAAYRSTATGATGMLLRLDDSNSVTGWNAGTRSMAQMTACESMSDIDTMSEIWNQGWWIKANQASAFTDRAWDLVCDDRMLYFISHWRGLADLGYSMLAPFGDFVAWKDPDAYACAAWHCTGPTFNSYTHAGLYSLGAGQPNGQIARAWHGMPGPVVTRLAGISNPTGTVGGMVLGRWSGTRSPSPADNRIPLAPIFICEGTEEYAWRGQMPGIATPMRHIPYSHRQLISPAGTDELKLALSFTGIYLGTAASEAQMVWDLTGPWR